MANRKQQEIIERLTPNAQEVTVDEVENGAVLVHWTTSNGNYQACTVDRSGEIID